MQMLNINSRKAKQWQDAVREQMLALRITQAEMAQRLGVTQGGIGHWLNSTRKPNIDQINQLLRECHLPEFLVYPVVNRDIDEATRAPMIAWSAIPAQGATIPRSSHLESLVTPFSASGDAFCLEVSGDSYLPDFRSKEILLVDPQVRPRNGDFVIAEGHGLCKFLDTHEGHFLASGKDEPYFGGNVIGVVTGSWTKRR